MIMDFCEQRNDRRQRDWRFAAEVVVETGFGSTRDRIRTYNLRFRRPMLYPVELHALRKTPWRGRASNGDSSIEARVQAVNGRGSARRQFRDWQAAGTAPVVLADCFIRFALAGRMVVRSAAAAAHA